MSGTNLRSQKGNMTTTVVGVIMMLATLGVILATLSSSDSTLQLFQQEEQRAFYAAQSGLEYGLKRYLASDDVNEFTLNDLNIGGGVTADIRLTEKNGRVIITATGKTQKAVKKVQTVISGADSNYIPDYAVFSDSPVSNVVTVDSIKGKQNPALLYQNAPTLPKFDLGELKKLSKVTRKDGKSYYYDGDLTVDESFNPPPNTIVYAEGKITFKKGKWDGAVYFVANGDAAFADSWKNSDDDVKMVLYLPNSQKKVKLLPVNSDDDPVDFKVDKGEVIPQEPYAASITVIGGDLPFGYWIFWPFWLEVYDAPITVKIKVGDGNPMYPFGPSPGPHARSLRAKVNAGNVNDHHNPRTYVLPNDYAAGTPISVTATSWAWSRPWGRAYHRNLEANSVRDQDIVLALRDGDPVPDIPAFGSQRSAAEFIADYINFKTQRVSLEDNQVIYLFELASRDLSSPSADFQDLVMMVTLARERDDLAGPGDDDGDDDDDDDDDDDKNITNYLTLTGGIISEGAVLGMQTAKKDDKNITNKLRVIRDEDMIKSFLSHSINGNARIILSSKWKSLN
ncbi:MAG TPA: hypothetical protein ENJ10_08820 [Caldithrix abyssi]|uniref:Type 4 fimbrial biogenesis protein PilX N-terminal domain-containing protein n=1 Tax=Caldithrix abyssi TaxID=187145 RepID=A0A7V1LMI5_CALAY|nr:hypothetical protein [Caldithrix abyssi]